MEKRIIIVIEYCIGCRWLPRASWLAQELLMTFEVSLYGITLVPSKKAGTFRISLGDNIFWDRKNEGRFPELKVLKQRVRDVIEPKKDLGHSDKN